MLFHWWPPTLRVKARTIANQFVCLKIFGKSFIESAATEFNKILTVFNAIC